jgi:cell wall-associated NlpC family hydrolase
MTRQALISTVAAVALAAVGAPPAAAEPGDSVPAAASGPQALLTELRTLYRETGTATEAYNEAEERLRAQAAEADELTRRLAATRTGLADAREVAGSIARAQYRAGGTPLPGTLRLLLGEDPTAALRERTVARRAAAAQSAEIERLIAGERRADALATAAREALDARQSLAEEQRRQRDEVHRRLDEVAGLLAGLTAEEAAELAGLERDRAAAAQRDLLAGGTLGDDPLGDDAKPPSAAGERALAWALDQRGKPYAWGAEGPASFDSSGLAHAAWAHAGRPVPRTSGRQWRELPRVPLDELRPGDLVVYFDDASHVALYAGDGQVVHAPHPGGEVSLAPVAVEPVLGAVRPDAGR